MRIFGGILPFLGLRTFPVTRDGDITDVQNANYEADCLVAEWLGEGIQLAAYDIRRRQRG
jgi:hypothetical protein